LSANHDMLPILTITGGAGRIGTALLPFFRDRYRVRVADIRQPEVPPDELVTGDITDIAVAERALAGAAAVLHLAGNPSTSANWDEVRTANIEGTFNVFEAARRNNVARVVFASTNHVMGFYVLEQQFPIDTRLPIRPDSLYGVSKAFGEALGRYYSDAFGMSVICLRIGWFTPRSPDSDELNELWISARDLAQIVSLCLEAPRRFGIYNATSNNPPHRWDLASARDELGYVPQDDVTRVAVPGARFPYVDPAAGVHRGDTGGGTTSA
jgi:NAD+ dependent glucose-6-phosphate dehydrogenase